MTRDDGNYAGNIFAEDSFLMKNWLAIASVAASYILGKFLITALIGYTNDEAPRNYEKPEDEWKNMYAERYDESDDEDDVETENKGKDKSDGNRKTSAKQIRYKHYFKNEVGYPELANVGAQARSSEFYKLMSERRSVRQFDPNAKVDLAAIRSIVATAGEEWVNALKPLRTNWIKDYITEAPYLIIIFKKVYRTDSDGKKIRNYYSDVSVSIAIGILVSAIQYAGLVTVVTTPMNCGTQLSKLLDRPQNEKLVALLPVGYPAEGATIPNLERAPLDDVLAII